MKPWIKVKPRYDEAQWPPLSAKVSFVRIDPADLKLPGNNQSMSNWVFFVSSYILVLRYSFKVHPIKVTSQKHVWNNARDSALVEKMLEIFCNDFIW